MRVAVVVANVPPSAVGYDGRALGVGFVSRVSSRVCRFFMWRTTCLGFAAGGVSAGKLMVSDVLRVINGTPTKGKDFDTVVKARTTPCATLPTPATRLC